MPSDPLALALEHHRAGRVREAAGRYRELIAADPRHADALHWLGVLACQSGRPDHAIPLFERAASIRPDDPAAHHNLGTACLSAGRADDAVRAFERAARLAPDRGETLMAWGLAHLVRRAPGDADAAVFAFRQARLAGFDTAELHRNLGVVHLAAGRTDDAIEAFVGGLEKDPHDPAAWHHLALAHRHKGDLRQARKCLNKSLEIADDNARAWYALASLDAEAGNHDIAAALFAKAVKFDPTYVAAHHALGRALESAGRHAEALRAFAQAIRASRGTVKQSLAASPVSKTRDAYHDPDPLTTLEKRLTDPKALNFHHAMVANAAVFSPTHVPTDAIANLFDRYADTFDSHLREKLQYTAPELIAQAVARATASDDESKRYDILDLGCGTGLVGPLLRPIARTLDGVDLSPAILEKARAKNVYDRLDVGDMVAIVRDRPGAYNILVAADSIIYTGDLVPLFEAAATSLRPGGVFAFTVEAGTGDRYLLHPKTLRYTHSPAYLHHVASITGLTEESLTPIVPRHEGDKPVRGLLVVLRSPPSPGS
ncbi:MAG TPA: tetratricopeptide repeat protein [Tepidisphaeraceae bacterium]